MRFRKRLRTSCWFHLILLIAVMALLTVCDSTCLAGWPAKEPIQGVLYYRTLQSERFNMVPHAKPWNALASVRGEFVMLVSS